MTSDSRSCRDSSSVSFQNPRSLRHSRHYCKERLTKRTARVYVFVVADELNAERPKFLQCQKQVLGGAGESVKAPHLDCFEPALAGVLHEPVKLRPGLLCTRPTRINIFASGLQGSRRAIGSQIAELKLTTLVLRTDVCIYSDSHGFVLPRT
jgi:hypothetical protein